MCAGVESASLKGDDKSQIEVTGDGVDPVQLISLLRKSMRHAELVSVSAVGGEKKEEEAKPAAFVGHIIHLIIMCMRCHHMDMPSTMNPLAPSCKRQEFYRGQPNREMHGFNFLISLSLGILILCLAAAAVHDYVKRALISMLHVLRDV